MERKEGKGKREVRTEVNACKCSHYAYITADYTRVRLIWGTAWS